MSSSLDPSMGELLGHSAGLGTSVKEMYQSRPGSFLPILLIVSLLPTPNAMQVVYRVLFRDSIVWEALNLPCAALSTAQS